MWGGKKSEGVGVEGLRSGQAAGFYKTGWIGNGIGEGGGVKTGDAPQASVGISWRDAADNLICLMIIRWERRQREREREEKERRPQKKTPNVKQRWHFEEICIFFAFFRRNILSIQKKVVPLHAFSACERYGYAQMHIYNSGTRPMSDGIF